MGGKRIGIVIAAVVLIAALTRPSGLIGGHQAMAAPGDLTVTHQQTITIPDSRIVSLSPDGRLIAVVRPITGYQKGELCVVDSATGDEQSCADLSVLDSGIRAEDITWSPDGTKIAFSETSLLTFKDGDLWLMDVATGTLTNLDDDDYTGPILLFTGDDPPPAFISVPVNPSFSPDGSTIAFSQSIIRDGEMTGTNIATVALDGSDQRTLTRVTLDTPGVIYFGIRWAPDGSRIYYGFHHPDLRDPRNGVWEVNRDGLGQTQIAKATDPDLGAPTIMQVSADDSTLLLYYPYVAMRLDNLGQTPYALLDRATGDVTPIQVPDPSAPANAWVQMAVLSSDGSMLLTVSTGTDPNNAVWVSEVGGVAEKHLGEPITNAGPSFLGLPLTWASDGSVLIPGDGELSSATIVRIDGVRVETAQPPVVSSPSTPTIDQSRLTDDAFAHGETVVVTTGGARLRATPSPDAVAVLDVSGGTFVTVVGDAVVVGGARWWPVVEPVTETLGWVREGSLRAVQ